eukprot:60942_1
MSDLDTLYDEYVDKYKAKPTTTQFSRYAKIKYKNASDYIKNKATNHRSRHSISLTTSHISQHNNNSTPNRQRRSQSSMNMCINADDQSKFSDFSGMKQAFSDLLKKKTPIYEEIKQVDSRTEDDVPQEIRNPYIIIAGISTYDGIKNKSLFGVDIDIKKMKELFTDKYNFNHIACINDKYKSNKITKQQLNTFLNEQRTKIENSGKTLDGLIFVYSGHGGGNNASGSVICSDNQHYFINDIQQKFKASDCERLRGKPKLFYFDCCRVQENRSNELSKGTYNSVSYHSNDENEFFTHYACCNNKTAQLNRKTGSYMINAIFECHINSINQYLRSSNSSPQLLTDITVKINKQINKSKKGQQTSECVHRLLYRFYIIPNKSKCNKPSSASHIFIKEQQESSGKKKIENKAKLFTKNRQFNQGAISLYFFKAGDLMKINKSSVTYKSTHSGYNTAYGKMIMSKGRHKFKIKILRMCGTGVGVCIGIASNSNNCNSKFYGGNDPYFVVYGCSEGKVMSHITNGFYNYGEAVRTNDVITMHLNLNIPEISFSKNGKDFGVADKNFQKTDYRLAICMKHDGEAAVEIVSYSDNDDIQREEEQKIREELERKRKENERKRREELEKKRKEEETKGRVELERKRIEGQRKRREELERNRIEGQRKKK